MLLRLYASAAGLWLLLTILWQFDYCRERFRLLRKINALHILPIWTFFAPRPGMSDTHILFRDKLPDGHATRWEEVALVEPRRPFHSVWNPLKRLDKVAVDAISDVKTVKNRGDSRDVAPETLQQHVKLSKGYLVLMNIAFSYPKLDPAAQARQFVVVESNHDAGQRHITPLFFSPFHSF